MYTVLTTGVGAVIGYGIVRSLRASRFPVRIVGMDIFADAVGQHWCDAFEPAVLAADPGYPEFLKRMIHTHSVDLVLPGIEQDVARMAEERGRGTFEGLTARFALNDQALISLAADKWQMHEQLVQAGLPAIPTRVDGGFQELAEELGLPLLLKPRRSYASKGIRTLHSEEDLAYWKGQLGPEFMVQERVGDDDAEYTVGAFGLGDGTCSQQITFQRKLSGEGATAKARLVSLPQLENLVTRLVALFKPVGPTNLQFRYHRGQFLLLEINPRISSSTSLRTAFGFNEAEMCLEYYLEGNRPARRTLRAGSAVRYIEDLVSYDRTDL